MGDAQFNGTPEEWDALVKKNKKKQTAVEWLLDNLNTEPYSEADFEHNRECWDKAKEIEKEQIMQAFGNGKINGDKNWAHRYYKQTFKSDGETLDTDTTI